MLHKQNRLPSEIKIDNVIPEQLTTIYFGILDIKFKIQ